MKNSFPWWTALYGLGTLGLAFTAWHFTPEPNQTKPSMLRQLQPNPVLASTSGTPEQTNRHAGESGDRNPKSNIPVSENCLEANPDTSISPPPKPPSRLKGDLALYVAEINPNTLQPIRVIAQNANTLFPLASTYKPAVLWAVLKGVDDKNIQLTEKFDVTRSNQSLGDYPYDRSTVITLAQRMIQHSDNTATDILHRRIGLPQVQRIADDLYLCRTRLLLPTKAWWTAQSGLAPSFKDNILQGARRYANASPYQRQRIAINIDRAAQKVDAATLNKALDAYFQSKRYNPEIDLGTQNVTTAFEYATLLSHAFLNNQLSKESASIWQNTMGLGVGKKMLKVDFDQFGGKTGNTWRILTAAGYLHTKNNHHYVYVFLNQRSPYSYTIPRLHDAFSWINAALLQLGAPAQAVVAPASKTEPQPSPSNKPHSNPITAPQKPNELPSRAAHPS